METVLLIQAPVMRQIHSIGAPTPIVWRRGKPLRAVRELYVEDECVEEKKIEDSTKEDGQENSWHEIQGGRTRNGGLFRR